MSVNPQHRLLEGLDESHRRIEALLARAPAGKAIYPGWTIKDFVAHLTGWDVAAVDSLRAHLAGQPPATPADRGLDEYNARTVSDRRDLDYETVLDEWRRTRQALRSLVEEMPEQVFSRPLVTPWGERGSVAYIVEVFREHEAEHAHDLLAWLQDPDHTLEKKGN